MSKTYMIKWHAKWGRFGYNTIKNKVRNKALKTARNIGVREPVVPKLTEYNKKLGPYLSAQEFDASFDEMPRQMPISGLVNIIYPWDE
jgi:hypothetical protein